MESPQSQNALIFKATIHRFKLITIMIYGKTEQTKGVNLNDKISTTVN